MRSEADRVGIVEVEPQVDLRFSIHDLHNRLVVLTAFRSIKGLQCCIKQQRNVFFQLLWHRLNGFKAMIHDANSFSYPTPAVPQPFPE